MDFSQYDKEGCPECPTHRLMCTGLNQFYGDFATMTNQVKEVCEAVAAMKEEKKTGLVLHQFWGPIVVAVIVLADKLLMHFAR